MKLEVLPEWLGEVPPEALDQTFADHSQNFMSKAQVDQLRELFRYGFHLYGEFEMLVYDYPQEFLGTAPYRLKPLGERVFADKRLVRLVLEPKGPSDAHSVQSMCVRFSTWPD